MFRYYRERAKFKPYEVAVEMSVSPMTISRWELGHTEPLISQFSRLCRLYKLTDTEKLALLDEYACEKEAM